MADAMSPNPSPGPRQRAPMTSRLQSATSPFFLGSDDDQLERAQARASRAAAIHRNSIAVTAPPPPADPCLCNEQIVELFKNCIKLASENKINQKNTSELNLIDHLSEIIKVEAEDDAETNFQKASCKLEAGVKIYSLRVDSMHSEAYKVLGGINRAGREAGVNKIEVQYDKTSKQVDVHALKETLWGHMRESVQMPEIDLKAMVSFRHVLGNFPAEFQAAACEDILTHLCFICLLHLANEHGLTIHDCSSLDDLHIYFLCAEVHVA